MQLRSIGSLNVSVVGIGCNNFGREPDGHATNRIVHAAIDAGITFFDTADIHTLLQTQPKCASGTNQECKGSR